MVFSAAFLVTRHRDRRVCLEIFVHHSTSLFPNPGQKKFHTRIGMVSSHLAVSLKTYSNRNPICQSLGTILILLTTGEGYCPSPVWSTIIQYVQIVK